VADVDEQGRPRLSWVRPLRLPNYLAAFLFTGALGCGLYYVVGLLVQDFAGGRARDLPGHLFMAFMLGGIFSVFACTLGRILIYGPTPRRITFGPEALDFEPALIHVPGEAV
jgi:hypothetical protein